MLRLKIGQNFLLAEYNQDTKHTLDAVIPYMMGCFKGTGKVATISDCYNPNEVVKMLKEMRVSELYILQHLNYLGVGKEVQREVLAETRYYLQKIIGKTREIDPSIKIKVININAFYKRGEYLLSQDLYKQLLEDETSILSILPKLETHKFMSRRLAAIPEEIKVIDNDLQKLNKTKSVCDRQVSLKTIDYLRLIENAKMVGSSLELTLKELPIYPSDEMGQIFSYEEMKKNKYLYKAAKYIYQGNHFGMVKTRIKIGTNFYPEFIETLDKRFDSMLQCHNWSTIGYPHFGVNHFCAGEFNDVIAHAKEYGLDYYFIALKQYLTTANMKDTAGYRVWWYPIYDNEGKMVYCAGMDIAIEEFIRKINPEVYELLSHMKTWEEKTEYLGSRLNFREDAILRWGCSGLSYYHNNKEDSFLQLCRETEPEVYKEIMKGRETNG